ncbi:MAG TPA: DUF2505 domain-containing protein [Kineosporiaceae bacterium]|nr:DUF2505 domain-containing protein [Kineosporiaceae bacterium]
MRITAEIHYDADPGTVFRMISDVSFQERKCQATGALDHEVEVEEYDDGGALVRSHRTLPADGVPDFVKSLVGPTLRVTQVDDWAGPGPDGSREGTAVVEIAGAPLRFTATLRLEPNGTGSRQSVQGDLKASVPLVGGRIEKAAEPAILAAVRAEQRTAQAWLADG